MCSVKLVGLCKSPVFQRANTILNELGAQVQSTTEGLFESDWQLFQTEALGYSQEGLDFVCWINGQLYTSIESLLDWGVSHYKYTESLSLSAFESLAEEAYLQKLNSPKKKYVQWAFQVADLSEQRILIELDFGLCPKTCENFWQLSIGYRDLAYRNSNIHRIVPKGYIEGGFLGTVDSSIYGGFFQDENYAYTHDKPGVLGMSKAGKHQNGSVFYITLRSLPHLNGKNVAFGRVVEGLDTLKKIEMLKTENQRPAEICSIARCEDYLNLVVPGTGRPQSQKEQVQSKLEGADIETLMLRRQAILKEIESTREELEQQKKFRNVLSQLIEELKSQA